MTDFVRDERWLERKHQLQEYFASLEPQHVIVSSLGIPLKYSGYFALIPGNFDVQAHLVQYPLTNYMFVEDNTGHIKAVTRSGSLNNTSLNFDQDRLIYLMGLISSIPAGNKDSITEDGFVSINSTVIRNFFKDYLSYLDYLIQTGVLCTDGIYIQGEKSKGYKFTERYAHAPMVNYEYPAFRQSRLAEAFPIEIYSEEHKDFIPNPLCDYSPPFCSMAAKECLMEKDITQSYQLDGDEYVAGIKLDQDNPEFFNAAKLVLETDKPLIYLTGKAGTGKTTFLKYIVSQYKENMVVLAPTGKAAVNAGGQTIHSFFYLDPYRIYLPNDPVFQPSNIYKWLKYNNNKRQLLASLSLIVIDEVSMVRCDVLDAIDNILRVYRRKNVPFGGVRMLLIGDVFQLPPVVKPPEREILKQEYDSPYFFDAKVYKNSVPPYTPFYVELEKPQRQKEEEFLSWLNKIRVNNISEDELDELNSKLVKAGLPKPSQGGTSIFLAPRTDTVDEYNEKEFSKLKAEAYEFKAEVMGEFPISMYPVDAKLKLKVNAQVMIMKNCWNPSTQSFVYYNGNIGIVKDIKENSIAVELSDGNFAGRMVEIEKATWDNIEYRLVEKEDEQDGIKKKTKTVETVIIGTFTQYPLRLAWAVTIHKSQGMTFDTIYADLSQCKNFGQAYVALSRCRQQSGVHLLYPLRMDNIKIDKRVLDFAEKATPQTTITEEIEKDKADKLYKQCHEELKKGLILEALATLEKAIQVRDDRRTPVFKKYCNLINDRFNHYKELSSVLYGEKVRYEKSIAIQERYIAFLNSQIGGMECVIRGEEQINEEKTQQIQNLYEQVSDLNEKVHNYQNTCDNRLEEITDLKFAIKEKEEINEAYGRKIQDYRFQISDLDKQISVTEVLHKGQMELREQEISQLNKKIGEQVGALKHEKMMNESNALKIRELETDKMKLQMEIDRLNNMTWWQKLRNKQ